MFQVHDRTRRRLAFTAFLLLGVLPTVSLLAFGLARKLPGHIRREAARLSTHLGLDVSLSGLDHPRPGVILYRGLRLANPETGQILLECERLEARFRKAPDGESRRGRELVVTAGQILADADGLDSLRGLLDRVLRRQTGWPETDVRATAAQLILEGLPNPWSLTDVEGRIETSSAGASAELRFRPAGTERPEAVLVRLVRNRQVHPPADELTIDTGAVAVPCELLALPNEVSLPVTARTAWLLGRLPTAGSMSPVVSEAATSNAP